ncbi:PAS domain-containing sensor histidine kinase [Poseidonibacter lekithochrous]|uniref:PAS domain-containing sensor histidine kinase n=1 Tax=Poseidonibacter lekithochrous TaxID=1904463 RepID=UPI000D360955|nr:ATP-binding protein [Poseidonibacter lekithochrous]
MYNDKFNLICESINSGILLLDKDLNVKLWNRWLEIHTKIKAEEIIDKNIVDFYPNINIKILKRKVKTSLKLNSSTFYNTEQNRFLFDVKLNKITDSIFYNMQQSITISPFDLEEEIAIVYVYDTTLLSQTNYKLEKAKKELENKNIQLEEKHDEIERIINALTEGIIISDENFICRNVNLLGMSLLGYENKNEIIGKPLLDLIANDSKDLVLINLNHDELRTYEINFQKKDGSSFPAFASGQSILLDNKKRRISTIIDISNLKEKDRLLARQAKMADMGQMIANIAHQWRQPLSIICTTASGMKLYKELDRLTDDFFNESVDQIVHTTNHLSQTIDDFKNFIKDDKEKRVFSLQDIIQKDLTLLDGIIKTHHIQIHIENNSEDIVLKGYPNELIQAIVNIISNAKDALIEKNIEDKKIFIELNKDDKYGYLKIYDNAKGVENKIIDKLFEPYFSTKHNAQGTGLGLFMTHRIINDSMEGSIEVKNIAYKKENSSYSGACFTIKLPLLNK